MADLVAKAAREAGVPVALYRRLIGRGERSGRHARSPKGAYGQAQLMPETAKGLEREYGIDTSTPYGNLLGGAYYLKHQLDHFGGNLRKAVAAYNAGPGAVEKYNGVPPYAETQAYVARVLGGLKPGSLKIGPKGTPTKVDKLTGVATPTGPPDMSAFALESLGEIASGHKSKPTEQLGNLASAVASTPVAAAVEDVTAKPTRAKPGAATKHGKVVVRKGADRAGVHTQAAVLEFIGEIAGRVGRPLVLGTGTNHSKMTVNGNVSDHWDGHAGDIPATGRMLIRIGRAALIAAGMDPREARKVKGGLFNVNGHQIIFNTDQGGNHFDHVHVSVPH